MTKVKAFFRRTIFFDELTLYAEKANLQKDLMN
jgi:hypothetical protein